jgi:hypothetical protein
MPTRRLGRAALMAPEHESRRHPPYLPFPRYNWFGVVTPAKTSKETLAKIDAWFASILKVKEAKEKLASIGLAPASGALISALSDANSARTTPNSSARPPHPRGLEPSGPSPEWTRAGREYMAVSTLAVTRNCLLMPSASL